MTTSGGLPERVAFRVSTYLEVKKLTDSPIRIALFHAASEAGHLIKDMLENRDDVRIVALIDSAYLGSQEPRRYGRSLYMWADTGAELMIDAGGGYDVRDNVLEALDRRHPCIIWEKAAIKWFSSGELSTPKAPIVTVPDVTDAEVVIAKVLEVVAGLERLY